MVSFSAFQKVTTGVLINNKEAEKVQMIFGGLLHEQNEGSFFFGDSPTLQEIHYANNLMNIQLYNSTEN